jgi:hypothetical protein
MTTKRVTMQKIKDILRLKYEAQLSLRQLALSLSLSLGVISRYVQRAETVGLGWPLPDGISKKQGHRPKHLNLVSEGASAAISQIRRGN